MTLLQLSSHADHIRCLDLVVDDSAHGFVHFNLCLDLAQFLFHELFELLMLVDVVLEAGVEHRPDF